MHIEPLPRVTLLPSSYAPNGNGAAAPQMSAAVARELMEQPPAKALK